MGIGSHHSPKMITDEWLTPPEIIEALGPFDLDPCFLENRPWDTAKTHYTIKDNGLWKPWFGRIWLNPPYGKDTAVWLEKLVNHGNGIALIFARTETKMFFKYVWDAADTVLFIRGRLGFYRSDGTLPMKSGSGGPSVLIAYGSENAKILENSNIDGKFISLK